jgi:hypothetical protein
MPNLRWYSKKGITVCALFAAPSHSPKQTVQAFVHAINSQDWSRLDSLVATDFVRHSIAAGDPPVLPQFGVVL